MMNRAAPGGRRQMPGDLLSGKRPRRARRSGSRTRAAIMGLQQIGGGLFKAGDAKAGERCAPRTGNPGTPAQVIPNPGAPAMSTLLCQNIGSVPPALARFSACGASGEQLHIGEQPQ